MSRKSRQEFAPSQKENLSRRVKILNDKYHKKNYETKKNELEIKNKLTELTKTVRELTKKVEDLSKSDKAFQEEEESNRCDYIPKQDVDNRNDIYYQNYENYRDLENFRDENFKDDNFKDENFKDWYNPYDKKSSRECLEDYEYSEEEYKEFEETYNDIYGFLDTYERV